jgi:hypothetical protein
MVSADEELLLTYSESFSTTTPLLMEASDALLDSLKSNQVNIKTDGSGIAYLSTADSTYQIRRVDNSNTQLLVSESASSSCCVEFASTGIMHVQRLWASSLPDDEVRALFETAVQKGITDVLPYVSQRTIWSDAEILKHFRTNDNYYMDNGKWRRIADEALYADVESLLNICAIVGGGSEFNSEQIWMHFNESGEAEGRSAISISYVQYLLSRLSTGESCINKGESDWTLNMSIDENKVIIHRGRQLLFAKLRVKANRPSVDDFILEWRQCLETTVAVEAYLLDDASLMSLLPKVLDGRAVLDGDMIIGLDSRFLNIDIDKRAEQLFKCKSRWEKIEFEKFFVDLVPPGTKPESLLLKTCRLDTDSGDALFYLKKL